MGVRTERTVFTLFNSPPTTVDSGFFVGLPKERGAQRAAADGEEMENRPRSKEKINKLSLELNSLSGPLTVCN